MASKILKEYAGAIKNYCAATGLSFDKLCASSYCYGDYDLIFQYEDMENDGKPWILDETPMPVILEIYLENGKLRFVQTDITHKHLGVDRETESSIVAKRPAAQKIASRELAYA